MALGKEYSTNHAYFIAGGKTLETIEKYIHDSEHYSEIVDGIAAEYGAKDVVGSRYEVSFFFENEVNIPGLKLDRPPKENKEDGPSWVYDADADTPEGQAIMERFADLPHLDLTQRIFAKRLTGVQEVPTNPDNLQEGFGSDTPDHYRENAMATAATFSKYGDVYVVSVPRTIHAYYDEASKEASVKHSFNVAAGYTYDWFTPPDSVEIPYSKVIELGEAELGDQLEKRTVKKQVPAIPPRKR